MNTLTSAKESFDILYENFSIPVVLFDSSAKLIKVNKSFTDLTGTGKEDIKIRSLFFFFNNLKTSFEQGWYLKAIPENYETTLMNIEGETIPIRMHFIKLEKGKEAHEGVLGFISDLKPTITAQRRIEELDLENQTYKEHLSGKEVDQILHEKIALSKELAEAKDFLQNILDSCGDGIYSIGSNGKIALVNESFAAMLGRKKEELIGTFAYEMGPMSGTFRSTAGDTILLDHSYSDYQADQLKKMRDLIARGGGKIENWEYYFFNKKGEIVPSELTVSIKKSDEGSLIGSVATARNLTKRRIAEKEIKRSRAFFEKVIESSHDGIIVGKIDGTILLANSAFERITGHSKGSLVGKQFFSLIENEDGIEETFKKRISELLTKGYTSFETSFTNKDGKVVYLEQGNSLIKDIGDKDPLVVAILRDITEKKKAAQALKEANQYRNQFFTNITHAFRTPLTLAMGPIEGMLQGEFGKIDKNIKEQLSVALKNLRQLMKLIDQLLDFSMLESGKRTYIYEKRDLNNLTAAILDSFTFISKKKKINLTFAFNSETPYISIDPVKVEKVLYDIIGNAFKFTPDEGSITITIDDARDISFSPSATKGDYTKIAVSDTGKGIKREHLGLIFDRFKQGMDDFTPKDIGHGIGLAHAKELIEHMGGEITVTSEYGKGSTFTIYLPVQKEVLGKAPKNMAGSNELLNQPPEIELSDISLGNAAPEERVTGKRPLLLIVDDNLDVINYVSNIVKKEYDFITARNGEEGLNKLKQHTPDLILCDIMMPEMDGCEFLKRVRSNSPLMNIPFILLTARADEEMEIECLAEGADDYIVKPFNSLILLARIKALLRIRNLMSRTKEQEKKISTLTKKLQGKYRYGNIIGSSSPMRKIYELLETIRESDATVLIAGETGTGKELIANSIHYNSKRKSAPMVSVNCGAIPRELVEREFFGHVKGAYTGAFETRKGYFEEADGGTLFLDEIGTMDNDMQVKLLRVLERKEIVKVGNSTPTKVDVRLIAATNKDLLSEVRKGTFREDLYYRIHVIPINVPPLKQRREDIPLLIEHFIKGYQSRCKKKISDLSQKERDMLMTYTYPGNVRELENIIERYCLLGTSVESLLKEQPQELKEPLPQVSFETFLSGPNPLKAAAQNARARAEKEVIMHALKISDNDNKKAAKILNIGLSSLYRKLKECNNF